MTSSYGTTSDQHLIDMREAPGAVTSVHRVWLPPPRRHKHNHVRQAPCLSWALMHSSSSRFCPSSSSSLHATGSTATRHTLAARHRQKWREWPRGWTMMLHRSCGRTALVLSGEPRGPPFLLRGPQPLLRPHHLKLGLGDPAGRAMCVRVPR